MYNRVWKITLNNNGFTSTILVEGTEEEMLDYMDSELSGVWKRYTGATAEEVKLFKQLNTPIYLAPKKH